MTSFTGYSFKVKYKIFAMYGKQKHINAKAQQNCENINDYRVV